jgi:hypothetical protein
MISDNNRMLARLAEIAARATALHQAMQGLPEPAAADAAAPLTLPALVARWEKIHAELGEPGRVHRGMIDELEWIETTIAATPPRGNADLIAKAELLRRMVEGDPDQMGSTRALAAALVADIERIVGGGSC